MKTKTIYLLRHGDIKKFELRSYIGQLDLPLTQTGIEQAEAWHRFFKGKLSKEIICSDLGRCRHTAKIIAGEFSDRICINEKFREISLGEWEGVPVNEIREKFPEVWEARGKNLADIRPPGGESFSDLAGRVIPAFNALCERIENDTLIVAHSGVNRVILAHIMGMDLNKILEIPQDYGALNTIEVTGRQMKVQELNVTN